MQTRVGPLLATLMSSYGPAAIDSEGFFSWCPPSPLALTTSLPPHPLCSLSSEERELYALYLEEMGG